MQLIVVTPARTRHSRLNGYIKITMFDFYNNDGGSGSLCFRSQNLHAFSHSGAILARFLFHVGFVTLKATGMYFERPMGKAAEMYFERPMR